ncbi:MAG: hypothetical protein U0353_21710 [Sandaracinus sp.]
MISEDVRIQGFDARAFTNLVSLFAPNVVYRHERDPIDSDAPELAPHLPEEGEVRDGTLVVVVSDRGTVRKAFHTVHGRVRDLELESPERLEGVPERYGAKRVIVLREGVLEDLFARASARMHREDDYVAQWLQVVRAIREEMDAGRLVIHPRPFTSVPLPTSQLVRRTLDSVLPDDRSFVLAVWRGHSLWTAAALRRRAGEIDWVAGPDQLLAWTGPLGGDWRRDHRVLSQAVTAHIAPVHLGLYGDLRSVRRLLRSREAGAWAKAVASREVILHPTPPYVAVALGADAVRRVAQKSTDLLGRLGVTERLDPLRQLVPVLGALRGRVAEVASVTQTLGFDPLKLLAQFLERVDPDDADEEASDVDGAAASGRFGDADTESDLYDVSAKSAADPFDPSASEDDAEREALARAATLYGHLDADDGAGGVDDLGDLLGDAESANGAADDDEHGQDEGDGRDTSERRREREGDQEP